MIGGPFSFITGCLCLLGSGLASLYETNKQELANELYEAQGYHPSIQMFLYDGDRPKLLSHYDYKLVIEEIEKEYPRMSDTNKFNLAMIAIAKRLMEEETPYQYEVPETYRFLGDVERFANENCKVKQEEL